MQGLVIPHICCSSFRFRHTRLATCLYEECSFMYVIYLGLWSGYFGQDRKNVICLTFRTCYCNDFGSKRTRCVKKVQGTRMQLRYDNQVTRFIINYKSNHEILFNKIWFRLQRQLTNYMQGTPFFPTMGGVSFRF